MNRSPSALALVASLLGLFLGASAVGIGLAGAFAAGSRVATVVSMFALPAAFMLGMQIWFGLALFSVIPRLLGLRRPKSTRAPTGRGATPDLPGSFVFLPLSSAAGALSGIVAGVASSTHSAWLVMLAYWVVGTAHGLLAWRLARAGYLIPPESI